MVAPEVQAMAIKWKVRMKRWRYADGYPTGKKIVQKSDEKTSWDGAKTL